MIKVFVDGTFMKGIYGGGYCVFDDDTLIYQDCGIGKEEPELIAMRNISGEMSAAMHGTYWLFKNNKTGMIVHDYVGLAKWVTGEWQATKEYTQKYCDFMSWYFKQGIIDFEWVKGHTKVLGNEIADRLAKQAVQNKLVWKD